MISKILSQKICFGSANECAEKVTVDKNECLKPCEGVYADVTKYDADEIEKNNYGALLDIYSRYKRFFDQTAPGDIVLKQFNDSISTNLTHSRISTKT